MKEYKSASKTDFVIRIMKINQLTLIRIIEILYAGFAVF